MEAGEHFGLAKARPAQRLLLLSALSVVLEIVELLDIVTARCHFKILEPVLLHVLTIEKESQHSSCCCIALLQEGA